MASRIVRCRSGWSRGAAGEQPQRCCSSRASRAAGGKVRHPRRRQLDGQRQAIQAPHDPGDGRSVVRGERKAGVRGLRPVDEERHRRGPCASSTRKWCAAAGSASGPTGTTCSPRQPQRLAAGHQDTQSGAVASRSATTGAASSTCSKLSRTSSSARCAEISGELVGERSRAHLPDAERRGDCRGDQGRITDRREIDERPRHRRSRRPGSRPPRGRGGSCPYRPGRSASPAGSRPISTRH